VGTVLRLKWALVDEAQIGFVYQCCGLQSMSRALVLQIAVRYSVEFFVDKRHQGLEGLLISRSPFHQQLADGLRR